MRSSLDWMQLETSAYAPEMKVTDVIQVVAAFCATAQHLLPACQRTCKYLEYQGDPCVRVALFLLSSNSYRRPDGGAKKLWKPAAPGQHIYNPLSVCVGLRQLADPFVTCAMQFGHRKLDRCFNFCIHIQAPYERTVVAWFIFLV